MTETRTIAGCPVFIDGNGPQTLVMIHGWPDTHRIWSNQVAFFRDRYRCVTFSLPGFNEADEGHSLDQIIGSIAAVVDGVSPDAPVILMIHDWGCVFGYEYLRRHPQRVSRLVAIDIGDSNSRAFQRQLPITAKLMVLTYQSILAASWHIGGRIGDGITRGLAKALDGKAHPEHVHAGMNYPYAMRWTRALGGLDALGEVEPSCPFFYAWGRKKPFLFHSRRWQERVAATPGNHTQEFNCGHWVMVDAAASFNPAVAAWLEAGRD
jgi:pimeloyl-ACP methyl ester carboxylesterase